jgi:predicted Zn finger-like uncharacterized protein
MTDMVTQCPQCQTAFRVTEPQLQAAHGAVRCGSCLHIFMAADHKLSDIDSSETDTATQTSIQTSYSNTQALDDDLFIDDDASSSVITDDMLEEIDQLIGDPADEQLSDSYLALDQGLISPNVFSEDDAISEEQIENEDWAQDLLREDDKPAETEITSYESLLASAEQQTEPAAELPLYDNIEDEFSLPDDGIEEHETEFVIHDEPLIAGERIGDNHEENKEELLANIQPEPVIFNDPANSRAWRSAGWALILLLGLAGLTGQYLQANFDQLAKNPNFRPGFEHACNVFGCELPKQLDIKQIRTSNLIVRSHPERKKALMMDTILTNHALFQQPYPLLELRFTNSDGKVIAAGKFHPDQYLAGELLGSQQMPSQQPIHVSLPITDPGPDAVNYQLFLKPLQ